MFWLFSYAAVADNSTGRQAIASAHPLATEAGMAIFAEGGNAFDAAVAVSSVLAVVEPYSSGFGGGGFWLLHQAKNSQDVMIDGREIAPQAMNADSFLDKNGNVMDHLSVDGALAAAIPGEAAALAHIATKYGRLPLSTSLAPAIAIARTGFLVDSIYRRLAKFRLKELQASENATKIFLRAGDVPLEGALLPQPELAQTLERLALEGAKGFYQGETAKRLVQAVRAAGGRWTLADLQNYQVKERKPVRGSFQGYEVVSAPPPSSGGIALISMLNMLEEKNWRAYKGAEQKHLVVEVMRRAYRDRAEYLGDPDFVDVPQERLLQQRYAAQLADSISMQQATPSTALVNVLPLSESDHTSHFSLLDENGNYVAATMSINYPFGSGFVATGTGILLNDEMDDFSAKPGVGNVFGLVGAQANAIAPGKRPLSSMSPTFVRSEDQLLVLGTPGGSRIISMVLLGILGFTQHGDVQSLVSAPRFHHQYLPDEIRFEPETFSRIEQARLLDLGHSLRPLEDSYGNMQAVYWDKKKNKVTAASDPRGLGRAVVR